MELRLFLLCVEATEIIPRRKGDRARQAPAIITSICNDLLGSGA
jgi:hypothetical protein